MLQHWGQDGRHGSEIMGDLTPNHTVFVLFWPIFDLFLDSADSPWVPCIDASTQVCPPENEKLKIGIFAGKRNCRNIKNLRIHHFGGNLVIFEAHSRSSTAFLGSY